MIKANGQLYAITTAESFDYEFSETFSRGLFFLRGHNGSPEVRIGSSKAHYWTVESVLQTFAEKHYAHLSNLHYVPALFEALSEQVFYLTLPRLAEGQRGEAESILTDLLASKDNLEWIYGGCWEEEVGIDLQFTDAEIGRLERVCDQHPTVEYVSWGSFIYSKAKPQD